jgi:hypothetical protein
LGLLFVLAAVALFVVLWFPVLIGQRVLLGGDILYQLLPWGAEPGAHPPANFIVSDPILQMLPWQQFTAHELLSGRLPLWNPSAQGGAPFLSLDQPAVFSPFTLLAVPFPAAIGLSLAMLAKIVVGGVGTFMYLRLLKAGTVGAVLAAVAYAGSSFMIIWLAWPHAGVAALLPWSFFFTERYLAWPSRWALPALALVIGLQFFAGHAETSLHLAFALAIYAVVRVAWSRRWTALIGLAVAVVVGTLIAGIQLAPFLDLLGNTTLFSDRAAGGIGTAHLGFGGLSTWVFPNAAGNPSIDAGAGHFPNYSESTGFATVTALVLAPFGLWGLWLRNRAVAAALAVVGLVSAGIVYGPLLRISSRIPLLSTSNNQRLIVVLCFAVAVFGGLGIDWLLQAPRRSRRETLAPLPWLGLLGVLGVSAAGLVLLVKGERVDHYLPHVHTYIGFWLAVGVASLGAAGLLALSMWLDVRRQLAAAGLCALALVETAMFAGPFNPREDPNAVPPPSPAISWLQAHAEGEPVAALGGALIPESYMLYGLTDVRGYEVLSDARQRLYWSTADPGYDDSRLVMFLNQPRADWLAAAGVRYVLMTDTQPPLPGTSAVFHEPGVQIVEVPDPRPFVYAASQVQSAPTAAAAAATLAQDPLGAVVVEGCCAQASSAQVEMTQRVPGELDLKVNADGPATIVVEQSFAPGWEATVDGRSGTILPANVLYQAVTVPAGAHEVSLRYQPRSVTLGGFASLAGLLGLILLAGIPLIWRRRAHRA